MTKLVKNLIIGGTSTVVVAGGGTGIALALNKKGKTSVDQNVVIKHQEEIAQAKTELEKLQAKLNAATTSEELAKVDEEVKAWLEKNTSNINEIGENVEKQILEAEHQREQEILEANRLQKEKEYAEAGTLAAKEAVTQVNKQGNVQSTSNFLDEESKAAQAAFNNAKTTLEAPRFDTKTSGQADYEASQQAHVLRVEADRELVDSLKESTKESKAEIKKLAFEVAQAYEAHKTAKLDEKEAIKIARWIKAAELDKEYEAKQAALELRQAVAALNSRVEQEIGTTDTWTPEGQIVAPVVYKTPVLTQEAQDRLQAEDKKFELEQAARELAEATKNAQVQAPFSFGTFISGLGTVSDPTAIVKPAYKEDVVIPAPELQAAPMLVPHMVPAIHPQKEPRLIVELQAAPHLMIAGERGEVVATQEFAFEGIGQLFVPEPVTTFETPIAVPTVLATSDKAPFVTPNPVNDQIIPMVVPKVVNDQLTPMPIPVAGKMEVPIAVPTVLATSDKAPFVTPNPVNDQVIPMVVPKITEPQLIPQATPEKLPQVEMQVPPLYVQGILGGFIADRQGLVATHELAFEGSQTLDQFVDSLKESTKGLKEDAKQLAFETAKAQVVHKSAKLDAKEAIHAARLATFAELDKQFEAKQAALEQRKAVAEFNSRVDHGVGTVDVKAPYGQIVAPVVHATPSLTPEGEVNAAIAFAATAEQGHNVDTQTPVRHELTEDESKALDAKLVAHIKAIEAQSQSPVGIDAKESIDREMASRLLAIKADQERVATEARLEQEAKAFAATAAQGQGVDTLTPVRHELTDVESFALDAKLAANLKAREVQSQSPIGIISQERINRETSIRAAAVEAAQKWMIEEQQRIAIQAELDRLVAEQEAKEAAYAAQFGSSFYSPAYNNFMTGIFTDYEKLAKEYELQSVTNENQRWLGDLFATRFSTPVPRAQAMLDQLAKMTGTLDRNQAGFLGQQLVNEIYGRTDVVGIRITVANGNIEVKVVGPNGLNPDSVIETAKIPYTVMPTTASAALNPVHSITSQLADNPQDFKQVVVEQVAQQFKNMISQTVNGNTATNFGIQMLAYDIMGKLAEDIKGGAHFQLVPVEENVVESFRTAMHHSYIDRNTFLDAMQKAIQSSVRQAFERINMQTTGWRLIASFGSMDNFLSQILSSIQSMY